MKFEHDEDNTASKIRQKWSYFCICSQLFAVMVLCFALYAVSCGLMHVYVSIGGESPPPPYGSDIAVGNLFPINKGQWAILFGHTQGSEVNEREHEIIAKLFNTYDVDQDGVLSVGEFSAFIKETLDTENTFGLMDIDDDGAISYGELVYLLELLQSSSLFQEDLNDALLEIFGDLYDSEHEAEYIAQVFFEEHDDDQNNFISLDEYNAYTIQSEWEQYNNKEQDFHIAYDEFEEEFFESEYFLAAQQATKDIEEGKIDREQILSAIQSAKASGINSIGLKFKAHALDGVMSGSGSNSRRLLSVWSSFWSSLVKKTVKGVKSMAESVANCFDDDGLVQVKGSGLKAMSDIKVGDSIYDGNDYSKVFFIDGYDRNEMAKMSKIKFGNPMHDNYIIMTPHHLLYRWNYKVPVRSDSIQIGDVLDGVSSDYRGDFNYTVYDIVSVYEHPISPITMSGNLMVNGVRASAFARSAKHHARLQKSGAIFRWISNMIDERLAANMVEVFYNGFYRKLPRSQYTDLLIKNECSAAITVLFLPITFFIVVRKLLIQK